MIDRIMPSKTCVSMGTSSPVVLATKISSTMNGNTSAAAKGHPRIAPIPNHIMPCAVLNPPFQFMKAAAPSMVAYIANVDGRYAVDAWNIPGLVTEMITNMTAILGFIDRETTENSLLWHAAQVKANTIRRK